MGFIDSYKHLEKLCGEVLNNERRVSAYIDEMLNTPRGSYLVRGWDDDLKQLKHYRWVRNQIAHEPGCSESNMCTPEDALWLDNFYTRIMNQTDPLTLYAKATKSCAMTKSTHIYKTEPMTYDSPRQVVHKKSPQKDTGCLVFLICVLLIVGAAFLITKII